MKTTVLSVVFVVVAFTACQNATTSQNATAGSQNTIAVQNRNAAPKTDEHEDNAPRISLAEAKKEFDAGSAVFVDTRSVAAFQQEHIKGAINVPADALEARYKEIPTGKKIIAYCS